MTPGSQGLRWLKLGLLYAPKKRHPKLASHAANPLAIHLKENIYRIFFSARDEQNRSSVGAVDIDIVSQRIEQEHDKPVFEHGPAGSFYEHGVSIGCCYSAGGRRYILFMGWQNPPDKHWRGDIGRLILRDDLSMVLDPERPYMSRDKYDRTSLSYPWVEVDGNARYHIWYGSTLAWDAGNGEMLHVLKHAWSDDALSWNKDQRGIPHELARAQAFSRPTVMYDPDDGYHMWFSYRAGDKTPYRIGYAFSKDCDEWELRLKDAGIDVSPSGWDSEMIEYPFVFGHQGRHYMLYNGNGYGKTGFGLAILEND